MEGGEVEFRIIVWFAGRLFRSPLRSSGARLMFMEMKHWNKWNTFRAINDITNSLEVMRKVVCHAFKCISD